MKIKIPGYQAKSEKREKAEELGIDISSEFFNSTVKDVLGDAKKFKAHRF